MAKLVIRNSKKIPKLASKTDMNSLLERITKHQNRMDTQLQMLIVHPKITVASSSSKHRTLDWLVVPATNNLAASPRRTRIQILLVKPPRKKRSSSVAIERTTTTCSSPTPEAPVSERKKTERARASKLTARRGDAAHHRARPPPGPHAEHDGPAPAPPPPPPSTACSRRPGAVPRREAKIWPPSWSPPPTCCRFSRRSAAAAGEG